MAYKLTPKMIERLRKFSLIKSSEIPIKSVEETIQFAQAIREVDTTGVEPMISASEEMDLHLHEDTPRETPRADIERNARVTLENYFVTPPGNIPLKIGVDAPEALDPQTGRLKSKFKK